MLVTQMSTMTSCALSEPDGLQFYAKEPKLGCAPNLDSLPHSTKITAALTTLTDVWVPQLHLSMRSRESNTYGTFHLLTTCTLSMHAGSVQLSRHAVHTALWVVQCVLRVYCVRGNT